MTVQTTYLGRERQIPGVKWIASGKVRDIYEIDAERLLFVTSDRVSAFDVVMNEGIPHKGLVLTAITAYWFEVTRDVIENHLISTSVDDVAALPREWRDRLRGRVMVVRRAKPTTIEWVVRGYLAGSGWKEYQKVQSVCGVPLPAGLQNSSRLPEPILTPTTKEESGHDLPISPAEAKARVGAAIYEPCAHASIALFKRAGDVLARHGILLADTKFEFGVWRDKVILIDEALTPDSSRLWPADRVVPGQNPPSYDKQILRDWLETLDWNKQYPAPTLSQDVLERTASKYLEVCKKITGRLPAGVSA
ncbi:MAG: phosphoribosylaminoimidazolesuccinocarboxamide synthase [Planctomycetes bacterium]|nr:phosphoribosylaminoimidazolesuccinocarboxamide synthase [Planctomycetota bacterium]